MNGLLKSSCNILFFYETNHQKKQKLFYSKVDLVDCIMYIVNIKDMKVCFIRNSGRRAGVLISYVYDTITC